MHINNSILLNLFCSHIYQLWILLKFTVLQRSSLRSSSPISPQIDISRWFLVIIATNFNIEKSKKIPKKNIYEVKLFRNKNKNRAPVNRRQTPRFVGLDPEANHNDLLLGGCGGCTLYVYQRRKLLIILCFISIENLLIVC